MLIRRGESTELQVQAFYGHVCVAVKTCKHSDAFYADGAFPSSAPSFTDFYCHSHNIDAKGSSMSSIVSLRRLIYVSSSWTNYCTDELSVAMNVLRPSLDTCSAGT